MIDWTERFTGTRALPEPLRQKLRDVATIRKLAKGTRLFGPDQLPDSLFFLYDGRMRVSQSSEAGREIVLYRVDAGESCVLTTACILAEEAYNAEGIAETDLTVVQLPKREFDMLAAEESAFRSFVFAAYSRRLIDLMHVVDEVAFGRIDVRLAARLLDIAKTGDELLITHQELAVELGTAREVISRVLQDFSKRGWVTLSRGKVSLLDRASLQHLAETE